jgi:hypothetical protein
MVMVAVEVGVAVAVAVEVEVEVGVEQSWSSGADESLRSVSASLLGSAR